MFISKCKKHKCQVMSELLAKKPSDPRRLKSLRLGNTKATVGYWAELGRQSVSVWLVCLVCSTHRLNVGLTMVRVCVFTCSFLVQTVPIWHSWFLMVLVLWLVEIKWTLVQLSCFKWDHFHCNPDAKRSRKSRCFLKKMVSDCLQMIYGTDWQKHEWGMDQRRLNKPKSGCDVTRCQVNLDWMYYFIFLLKIIK